MPNDKDPYREAKIEGGKKGGRARAKNLSKEKLSEIGKKGAAARWKGHQKAIKATHYGTLQLGDLDIECAVLEDGQRVIHERMMLNALGRKYSGYYSQRDKRERAAAKPGVSLVPIPRYLSPKALRPFISEDLQQALQPIKYTRLIGGTALGVPAEALPRICDVWLSARDAGVLNVPAQERTAVKADLIMRALAHVGIVALVDEVTGYQSERKRDKLQQILQAYIAKELQPWIARFPLAFFEQMFRLRGWAFDPISSGKGPRGPRYAGKLVNHIVYDRLPPGVKKDLQSRNPVTTKGRRRHKHHQLLTPDIGHPHLQNHIIAVTAMMRGCETWEIFDMMLQRAFPRREEQIDSGLQSSTESETGE